METTRLSSKGQIVLPKSVRNARSWGAGTEFEVVEATQGVFLRPLRPFVPTTFDEVFGCLKYSGRPKTLAQMETAISKGVKARHDRGRY
jgi:AbrB family looped-hinge helix DNA binding protein